MLRGSTLQVEERDLGKNPLSEQELKALFGKRPAADFLNTRNEEAREKGWAKTPPSDAVLLKAMTANPNLIKRPILMMGKETLLGFDAKAYAKLV